MGVPNSVVQHHAKQCKPVALSAKLAAQIDYNTRLQQLCSDADNAHSSGNLKQFYALRNQVCLRKRSQRLVSNHHGDEILTKVLDVKQAFLQHFSCSVRYDC